MAEQTYYKLGLCPCGDMHNPFYLSEAKHRLPNALPGYYSIIDSGIPNVITIRLDPKSHAQELKISDNEQKQVKGPNLSHSAVHNRPIINRRPVYLTREFKPTILRAVVGNPVAYPQQNLMTTKQAINFSQATSSPTQIIRPLKPVILPKPGSSKGPPVENQNISILRSGVSSGRDEVSESEAYPTKVLNIPSKNNKRAPLPQGGVVMNSPFKTGNFNFFK